MSSAGNEKIITNSAMKTTLPGGATMLNGLNAIPKLSSLKPARDLTLGGRGTAGVTKKVFTPNLNVVRNKNTNVKTSKDTTARGRNRGRPERGVRGGIGRGARGGSLNYIQTAGLFSEGAGEVNIRKASYSRNTDDAPSTMRKPTVVKNESKNIDIKLDAAQVSELLGDSDDDDFLLNKTEMGLFPVKLNELKWKCVKPEIKLEFPIPNADVIKLEDDVTRDIQNLHLPQKKQQNTSGDARQPHTVAELLASEKAPIFIMQFPDALPFGVDGSDSPEKDNEEPAKVSTSDTPASKTNKTSIYSLKNKPEGKIGKLVRYKSGKTKLVLGDSHFDVEMGINTGFQQYLMSIETNREERSGNMINLGPLMGQLTVIPDWEYFLKKEEEQNRKRNDET
ncbi:uncharacterized protein LOC119668796 isoform X1 [Teleopsis dalmanni]|uniref:uncharacterized protein LOC119668796 isoform X1 n=1 Tax=Teleopsis dalmanni TaxID=139649 RepID=UPI0018CD84A4|nr:uncharacterized protein LOC119668796 isoform X1 [Teleopsis dalmanni]